MLSVLVLPFSVSLAFCAFRMHRDYTFSVAGTVADEDGSPVQDAEVILKLKSPVYEAITPVKTAKGLTNSSGVFNFMYLTEDKRGVEYTVTIRKEGFVPQTMSGSSPPAGSHTIRLKKVGG